MKGYEVILTEYAAGDLEELQEYVAQHDGPSKADHVLERIQRVIDTLAAFPERGSYPKALLALGFHEYRQAFFKPYRLIYRVIGHRVYVYLIVDGRRDMQTLLERRLLGA